MTRIALAFAAALAFLLIAIPASAHFLGYDSVDSNRRIRWDGLTQWRAERDYAVAVWNQLGRVSLEDVSWWNRNLTFKDTTRSDVTWVGLYQKESFADDIYFNNHYMNQYSENPRRNVALHELGHALGLDHSYAGQIMNAYVSSVITVQDHDRQDYCALWGCGGGGGGGGGGSCIGPSANLIDMPDNPDCPMPLARVPSVSMSIAEPYFVTDMRDTRRLVGAAHNVFIGRVARQTGNKQLDAHPETQFEVEVLENIKGELSGTVIVNQQAGFQDGALKSIGDRSLLVPGELMLFATRQNEAEGWHTVIPVHGRIKIQDINERTLVRGMFRQAREQEIPLELSPQGGGAQPAH